MDPPSLQPVHTNCVPGVPACGEVPGRPACGEAAAMVCRLPGVQLNSAEPAQGGLPSTVTVGPAILVLTVTCTVPGGGEPGGRLDNRP